MTIGKNAFSTNNAGKNSKPMKRNTTLLIRQVKKKFHNQEAPTRNEAHTGMSTPAYPPNFLQALLEASNFLESCKTSEISKEELILSMENRMSLLIGKAVSAPTGASFSVFNKE